MAHKKHHKGGKHHHTGEQHRGEHMHMHSHPGEDHLAHRSKKMHHVGKHHGEHHHAPHHDGVGDMSIAHGYNPPEHYQDGSDHSTDLGCNEKHC